MRIIAGQHKGRRLTAPSGRNTRPTSDKARGAVFNVISHAPWAPPIEGALVLDLFAGSGALGLEALSRGAAYAMFVDNDASARRAIETNVRDLRLDDKARLDRRSATRLGPRPSFTEQAFNLVFIDPPYHKGLVLPALQALLTKDWVSADALVVVETASDETTDFTDWTICDARTYGAAKIHFLSPDVSAT